MKLPLPRTLFPNLSLSPADDAMLESLVEVFIDKLLVEEHDHLVVREEVVDLSKWKPLRQNESVTVYREIAAKPAQSVSSPDPTSESPGAPRNTSHRLIPPFLVVGKVPGLLDDILYGFTTPTRESTLIKTSYVGDGISDVEVLRTVRGPTVDEPFSHLSVKWMLLAEHSAVVTPRDFVYVDTIGERVLPNGERIGYRIAHSIPLKGADPMTQYGFIRGNISVCGLFRQNAASDSVHMYGRVFFEPGGAIPRSISTLIASAQVNTAAATLLHAQLKKLALALRRTDARVWTVAAPAPQHAETTNGCGVCTKKLHLLNKSRSNCVLCSRRLCLSCRVRKLLSFAEADYSVTRLRVTFCVFCLQQAINLPPAIAAAEEFLSGQDDFYRPPTSFCCSAVSTANFSSV